MAYLNKNDCNPDEYMGLNNTICSNPKYYCKAHMIYLSDDDVSMKKCLCKPTIDLISTRHCNWLIPIEELWYGYI